MIENVIFSPQIVYSYLVGDPHIGGSSYTLIQYCEIYSNIVYYYILSHNGWIVIVSCINVYQDGGA